MGRTFITFAVLAAWPAGAFAQTPAPDTAPYIFTTLLFLIGGFLVFWMAAGFAMLEAGLVRHKNVTMQLTKNVGLFATAVLMYWLVGYNLMYPGDGWVIAGVLGQIFVMAAAEPVGLATADADLGYASLASDFFFQVMFCATAASIVSGTLAERVRLWPFLLFTALLTGLIYPISASWHWGGGFLAGLGFSDFAGSTVVHATGGAAALAGAIVLGPRIGKYRDGKVIAMPGSNLSLATLGMFILWLGWFGFNGGSQLAMGTISDATDVSRVFANTNMAAAAGAFAALALTQLVFGKVDLTMVLNGALAGLVSITAEPLFPSLFGAVLIGGVGGVIVVMAVPLLDRLRIDDVVGAIPVHLIAGIWGTMAVPITNPDASFGTQMLGVLVIGGFVFVLSLGIWLALRAVMGIRVSAQAETEGLDITELGMAAYPDAING